MLSFVFVSSDLADGAELRRFLGSVTPTDAILFVTRLFSKCGSDLTQFSDRAVADGLGFIAFTGESDWLRSLYDERIGWAVRAPCIKSIVTLYRDCFAPRCTKSYNPNLESANPLDATCYMWWDRFHSSGYPMATDATDELVGRALVEVMLRVLEIPSIPCWWSALHGLGHWYPTEAERAGEAIDRWLGANPSVPQALRDYAAKARRGNVL